MASIQYTTLFTVTGNDVNGCMNTDTLTVFAIFGNTALYLMPNAFTPNGDNVNDCYSIKNWRTILELDFGIYNRFGERVFHTADPNACWDGAYKGK